jgi:hypothetical protein
MAQSRYLPEPAVLDRLLTEAGLRVPKAAEAEMGQGEWVRFEDAPPPAAKLAPAPAAARAPARVPVTDFRIHDAREVKPKSSPVAHPPPEARDDRLSEELFGVGLKGLGVEQRLQKLVQWLVGGTGASSAFVADLEGLPLVNHNTPEPYIVAIGPLARAQAEIARFVPNSPPGTSIVELEHQNLLEVVWADTPIGRLGVGLVMTEPLTHTLVTRIRRVAALSVVSRGDT